MLKIKFIYYDEIWDIGYVQKWLLVWDKGNTIIFILNFSVLGMFVQ